MSFSSSLAACKNALHRQRPTPRQLLVEQLEDRTVPSSWLGQIGGTGFDYVPTAPGVMDAGGNLYLTGQFSNAVDFDFGPGVTNLTSAGGRDGFAAKYAPDGSLVWASRFGTALEDTPNNLALDSTGNVYVTGSYSTSAGPYDVFVCKFDGATGAPTWSKSFGAANADVANDIAVGDDGSVYVGGYFTSTVDFDPGPGIFNLTSTPTGRFAYGDAFVQKLDGNGNFVTAWKFGGDFGLPDSVQSLVVEGDHVFVVGRFGSTVDFDPGAGLQNRTSVGSTDAFLASYSTSGAFQWVQTIGGPGEDMSSDWHVASAGGRLLITGAFAQTIDADPGPGTLIFNAGTGNNAFVGEYSKADGSLLWAQSYGNGLPNGTRASVQPFVDPATGNLYIGGSFYGTVDLNPTATGGDLVSAGGRDGFLLKLDASGNYLNAWRFGGTGLNDGAIRPIGLLGSTIYSAGAFEATADFPTGGTLTSNGDVDAFLMAFDMPADPPPGVSVPKLSITSVSKAEGNSGVTAFTFTVTLSAASTETVTVNYATANGTAVSGSSGDYTSQTGTLTFLPGDTSKTITIWVTGDKRKEADETFYVNLTDPLNATILNGQGLGTIWNDD